MFIIEIKYHLTQVLISSLIAKKDYGNGKVYSKNLLEEKMLENILQIDESNNYYNIIITTQISLFLRTTSACIENLNILLFM